MSGRWGGLIIGFAALAGLGWAGPAEAAKVKVFVSIEPQAFFVERVGGDRVDVGVLVGPGQSPHSYEPTPRQMAGLAEAKVFFTIGVPFERRLVEKFRSTLETVKIVDCSQGIRRRKMVEPHSHQEGEADHHPDEKNPGAAQGEESEEGLDPHVWLSPRNGKTIAENIARTLAEQDPAGKAAYDRNLAALIQDLDRVDQEIAQTLKPVKGAQFLVYHPAFGYFAEAYGLVQVPVEIEGKEPGPKELAKLIEVAKEHRIRVVFVQPQFSRKSAEAVAQAIGGDVQPMDALARDYLKNLRTMAQTIRRGAGRTTAEPGTSRAAP